MRRRAAWPLAKPGGRGRRQREAWPHGRVALCDSCLPSDVATFSWHGSPGDLVASFPMDRLFILSCVLKAGAAVALGAAGLAAGGVAAGGPPRPVGPAARGGDEPW
ncbi:unnamed protein product, partial [Prorocentrum cordatum]